MVNVYYVSSGEAEKQAERAPHTYQQFIERYDMKEQVGRGSFATVHRAIDKQSNAVVAVKNIDVAKMNRTKRSQDFIQQEVVILKRLQHPHIIKFFDVFESPEHFILVME